jgi:hypothetical protein
MSRYSRSRACRRIGETNQRVDGAEWIRTDSHPASGGDIFTMAAQNHPSGGFAEKKRRDDCWREQQALFGGGYIS